MARRELKRGDVRWYRFSSSDKRRPVLVLGRDSLLHSGSEVPVIPSQHRPAACLGSGAQSPRRARRRVGAQAGVDSLRCGTRSGSLDLQLPSVPMGRSSGGTTDCARSGRTHRPRSGVTNLTREIMALTRDFKEAIWIRSQRDARRIMRHGKGGLKRNGKIPRYSCPASSTRACPERSARDRRRATWRAPPPSGVRVPRHRPSRGGSSRSVP